MNKIQNTLAINQSHCWLVIIRWSQFVLNTVAHWIRDDVDDLLFIICISVRSGIQLHIYFHSIAYYTLNGVRWVKIQLLEIVDDQFIVAFFFYQIMFQFIYWKVCRYRLTWAPNKQRRLNCSISIKQVMMKASMQFRWSRQPRVHIKFELRNASNWIIIIDSEKISLKIKTIFCVSFFLFYIYFCPYAWN